MDSLLDYDDDDDDDDRPTCEKCGEPLTSDEDGDGVMAMPVWFCEACPDEPEPTETEPMTFADARAALLARLEEYEEIRRKLLADPTTLNELWRPLQEANASVNSVIADLLHLNNAQAVADREHRRVAEKLFRT